MQSQTGLRVKIILSNFYSIWRMSPGLIFSSAFLFCAPLSRALLRGGGGTVAVPTCGRWRVSVCVVVVVGVARAHRQSASL